MLTDFLENRKQNGGYKRNNAKDGYYLDDGGPFDGILTHKTPLFTSLAGCLFGARAAAANSRKLEYVSRARQAAPLRGISENP